MTRALFLNLIFMFSLTSIAYGAKSKIIVFKVKKNRGVSSLKIPESYDYFMEKEKAKRNIIPEKAKDSKDEGQFFTSVIDHHFKNYLKENPDSSLSGIKNVEDTMSKGTSLTTESFKLKSKLNIAKGSAEINIDYLLNSRILFENHFGSINAELDFYSTGNTRLGLDFSSNREDTRTQLGFKFIW